MKLKERVEQSKELKWSYNSYFPGRYSTWGINPDGTKYYRIELSSTNEEVITPDGGKGITVLLVDCQKDIGNGNPYNCPSNEQDAICCHGLGALYESFKRAHKLISFFETYDSAIRMSFGGKIVKIKSVNGLGFIWAIIKNWPERKGL